MAQGLQLAALKLAVPQLLLELPWVQLLEQLLLLCQVPHQQPEQAFAQLPGQRQIQAQVKMMHQAGHVQAGGALPDCLGADWTLHQALLHLLAEAGQLAWAQNSAQETQLQGSSHWSLAWAVH